jgi:hypothetical protein
MKRIALLALVLAAGCSNKKPEERKLVGSAAPTPSTPAGSAATGSSAAAGSGAAGSAAGSGATGSGTAEAKGTGFQLFDDAMSGTKPWVAADDKAGLVELVAKEDLSGRTKGQFLVERRCGADAAKAVEAMGKQMAARVKDHDPAQCKEEAGVMSCFQPGLAEGDVVLEIQYAKAGDAWRPIGVKTYGVGMHADKEEAKYVALLKEKCK